MFERMSLLNANTSEIIYKHRTDAYNIINSKLIVMKEDLIIFEGK